MTPTLKELHPAGFAHIPVALLLRPEVQAGHILMYAAVTSVTPDRGGWREVRLSRLEERSRLSPRRFRPYLRDLIRWGYLAEEVRPGYPNRYLVLPTTDVRDQLAQEEEEDLEARPDVAAHRGGRPENPLGQNVQGGNDPDRKPPRTKRPGDPWTKRPGDSWTKRPPPNRGSREIESSSRTQENPLGQNVREGFPTDEEIFALALTKARTRQGVRNPQALASTMARDDREQLAAELLEAAARRTTLEAIDACLRCDDRRFVLGPDGLPLEPTILCDHNAAEVHPAVLEAAAG